MWFAVANNRTYACKTRVVHCPTGSCCNARATETARQLAMASAGANEAAVAFAGMRSLELAFVNALGISVALLQMRKHYGTNTFKPWLARASTS